MAKRLDPFAFFSILALVVGLLAVAACFAYPLAPPMTTYAVTSPTGYRVNPIGGGDAALHRGVDLVGPADCAILAAAAGVVVEHWPPPGTPVPGKPGKVFPGHSVMGGYIVIDHGDGTFTLYAHMSQTYVHTGDRIAAGQVIGRQGATGDATGPHLHFEVIINPLLFIAENAPVLPGMPRY